MSWIRISTSTELFRVKTEDIVYIKADGNYCDIYLYNMQHYTMTFKLQYFEEAFKKLQDSPFARVGRSFIINKDYVFVINTTNQELILSGDRLMEFIHIKTSKEALKEFKVYMEKE